ncbi:MAG: HNH endonuclease [Elusimicrobia bacterium]|nr:HNH endonuclease [Elusimicrobiota bacterium]
MPPREAAILKRDAIHVEAPGVIRYVFRSRPALLEKEDPFRRKARATRRSKNRVRRVARAVRDAVWRRDGGRCAFVSPDGVRCAALTKLEYDHIVPWSLGGASDDPANIRLLCRPHNLQRARAMFGGRVPRPPCLS